MIVSRQFEETSRSAIEDLYLQFPKLITDHQQHTYVESDKHTYLYIPVEELFLVLVTTKSSNIIDNQETIRMLYKVLIGICS